MDGYLIVDASAEDVRGALSQLPANERDAVQVRERAVEADPFSVEPRHETGAVETIVWIVENVAMGVAGNAVFHLLKSSADTLRKRFGDRSVVERDEVLPDDDGDAA